jgi:hypothetical protein
MHFQVKNTLKNNCNHTPKQKKKAKKREKEKHELCVDILYCKKKKNKAEG